MISFCERGEGGREKNYKNCVYVILRLYFIRYDLLSFILFYFSRLGWFRVSGTLEAERNRFVTIANYPKIAFESKEFRV